MLEICLIAVGAGGGAFALFSHGSDSLLPSIVPDATALPTETERGPLFGSAPPRCASANDVHEATKDYLDLDVSDIKALVPTGICPSLEWSGCYIDAGVRELCIGLASPPSNVDLVQCNSATDSGCNSGIADMSIDVRRHDGNIKVKCAAGVRITLLGISLAVGVHCGRPRASISRSNGHPLGAVQGNWVNSLSGNVYDPAGRLGYAEFLGIPFALPPDNDETRWKPPRDPKPWLGVKSTIAFEKACYQKVGPYPTQSNRFSEDCLYLNVWTPRMPEEGLAARGLLPVQVFIYGGGGTKGSAGEICADPTCYSDLNLEVDDKTSWTTQNISDDNIAYGGRPRLELFAQRGHVPKTLLVTMNYRLGVFGYLGGDDLRYNASGLDHTDENAKLDGTTGNWGVLDQRKALLWVQENIHSFGGDPDKILLFGESHGAASVSIQAVSNLSWSVPAGSRRQGKQTFTAAVMQSGAFHKFSWNAFARANATMHKAYEDFGCHGDKEERVACLHRIASECTTTTGTYFNGSAHGWYTNGSDSYPQQCAMLHWSQGDQPRAENAFEFTQPCYVGNSDKRSFSPEDGGWGCKPTQDGQDTQQWAATVDGVVLTGATGKLVEQGHVAPNVTYVLGSNAHEGVSFHGLFRNRYSNQDKSTACNNFSDTSWSTYPEASYETCLEQFFAAPRAATKFYTDTTPCFYSSDAKDSAGLVFSDPTTPANFPVPKPPFAPSRCDATPYGIAPVYFSLPLSAAWYGSDYEFTCGNQYLAEKLREYNHTTYVYYSTALFYDPQGFVNGSLQVASNNQEHAGEYWAYHGAELGFVFGQRVEGSQDNSHAKFVYNVAKRTNRRPGPDLGFAGQQEGTYSARLASQHVNRYAKEMNAASVCINELWGHIANGRKPWCLNIGNELHTGDGPFTWDPFDRPEKVLRWGPQEPTARGLFFMTEVQNSECDLLWLAENAYYVERGGLMVNHPPFNITSGYPCDPSQLNSTSCSTTDVLVG